jgi:hypothetical protein
MIINPMWFYWMGVFDKIHTMCLVVCIIVGTIGGSALAYHIFGDDEDASKAAKKLFLIALCFGLVGIFTPSENTMTKMLIASQVNETNVESVKEIVDYIIDKIDEVKGEQK